MIFVTVGTHEQQFDRLIEEVDNLKRTNSISEDVLIQSGYSNYKVKYCKNKKFLNYDEMIEAITQARIVITHGGPASFLVPLSLKKKPIVVPRMMKFNEHVNDHQVDFTKFYYEKTKSIDLVLDINVLGTVINSYENHEILSTNNNNKEFSIALKQRIETLWDI